jgi:acyl-CoA dehydrogenase
MDFGYSTRTRELAARLSAFMNQHIYPNEARFDEEIAQGDRWHPLELMEDLKRKAQAEGLWNLFMPKGEKDEGLSNYEYAPLAEIMGRVEWAAEVFNCSAPDTGNMEVLLRYGTGEQKRTWLEPLLAGKIRSAFAMTEPEVASSDATNISSAISRDGSEYVLDGHKWWATGALDRRCRLLIFMGKTDLDAPRHRQQSMILVPIDTPGVKVVRHLPVFGFDHAPHGHAEIIFSQVRVPATNLLLGEGRGFEIAQGRLGPGRIHHCMRLIGLAERALEMMCRRTRARVAFGKPISEQTVTLERIAQARILIDQARLLVLQTARTMDAEGNKAAAKQIAMIKVAVPGMAAQVIDWSIQAHGGGGVADPFLAGAYAGARALRLADGPDEVHRNQIGKMELASYAAHA